MTQPNDSKLLLETLLSKLCSTEVLAAQLISLLDEAIETAHKEGFKEGSESAKDLETLKEDSCCGCGGCDRQYEWKDYIATTEGSNPDYSSLPDELREIAERWDREKVDPLLNIH